MCVLCCLSSTENDELSSPDGVKVPADGPSPARPVISDVKLVSRDQLASSLTLSRYATTRRQRTLRTRLEPGRPSDDSCLTATQSTSPSSTFNDLPLYVSLISFVFLPKYCPEIAS